MKRSKTTEPFFLIIAAALVSLTCSGCSVVMALGGKKGPDPGTLTMGAARSDMEAQLGSPVQTTALENGYRRDVYEYEGAKDSSAVRALTHGALDVLTIGLWEVVGTPVEVLKANRYRSVITYDKNDRVVGIEQELQPKVWESKRRPDPEAAGARSEEPKGTGGPSEALLCEEMRRSSTQEACDAYLARFPHGSCAAEAAWKLEMLLWDEASQSASIAPLEAYLSRYPEGPHAGLVRARKEDLLCQEMRTKGDASACEAYLAQFPEGKCAGEAKEKSEGLVWAEASRGDSAAVDRYLSRYPAGVHVEEARERLDELSCVDAKSKGTRESYAGYLERFPNGKCADELRTGFETILWEEAERAGTVAAYDTYLGLYPNGARRAEAEQRKGVAELIGKLRSPGKDEREEATRTLSRMGDRLTEAEVGQVVALMENGRETWSEYLYRQSHCTWYEDTSVRYYAAVSLLEMNSPHVSEKIRNDARLAKDRGKKRRQVTDPGWV